MLGLMVGDSREPGKTTTWTVTEPILGKTEDSTLESIRTIKNMERECTNGLTEGSLKECG
jgi:hypothetical protein